MIWKFRSVPRALGFVVALSAVFVACGGSQAPAESPEAEPASTGEGASEPGASDAPGDGEHTMPDGTKMEGDQHGEHTMPDGTKMKGPEHGSGESK
jgi:hypothetical protein